MTAVIELDSITKTYHLGEIEVPVLKGINLSIPEGSYTAITGVSGSGKSTLMNILGCLDTPTSGSYRLAGRRVDGLSDSDLSVVRNKDIGFIYQTFNLLNRKSVFENVALPLYYSAGAYIDKKSVFDLIARVGLSDRTAHKPSELSGGQRQRVAIARALINKPAIILADEPTGNLDSGTTGEIMAIFDELNREGKTILIITHEEDIARHCGRTVHLSDGVISGDTAKENTRRRRKK